METGHRNQTVDWTGRAIAIVSLLGAIGVGGYVAMQDRVAEPDGEPLAALRSEFDGLIADQKQQQSVLTKTLEDAIDRNDQRLVEWNAKLNDATREFKSDATKLLDQMKLAESNAAEQRNTVFKQALADFRGELESRSSVDSLSKDERAVSNAADPAGLAQLTLADTRLRPAGGDETLIRLENNSDNDAWIRRLRFKPESDYRAETDASLAAAGTQNIVTIAYNATDNTSTKQGSHGIYIRPLAEPIRVPANESLTLRVVIDNTNHKGWGFEGQLMVEYNSEKPLIVKAARVQFDDLGKNDLVGSST